MSLAEEAEALFEQLKTWRRHIHAHPELSFMEKETSDYVAIELAQLKNIDIQQDIGGHGIVATLSTGDGPTIALRADMDALPIQENNNHEFISQNEGVMHACGHDAHTAMLLGAAHLLDEQFTKRELQGTVKFIFQPAEEATDDFGLSGAPYMIQAGVLEDVEAVIALHACPWHPVGVIQMNHGFSMANVDVFQAKIHASGGHGGYPQLATDPLWMLGPVLSSFYGTVGRRVSPLDVVAASIGRVEAGSASNIIPSEVEIEGTLRSYSPTAREQLAAEVENVFKIVESLGGSYSFELERGEPALNNHIEINELLEETIQDLYSDMYIHWEPFGMGGEDFGYMTEQIPGAMFFLGCSVEDDMNRDLHTSIFDIDENCLPIGTAIFATAVNRFLKKDDTTDGHWNKNSIQRGA